MIRALGALLILLLSLAPLQAHGFLIIDVDVAREGQLLGVRLVLDRREALMALEAAGLLAHGEAGDGVRLRRALAAWMAAGLALTADGTPLAGVELAGLEDDDGLLLRCRITAPLPPTAVALGLSTALHPAHQPPTIYRLRVDGGERLIHHEGDRVALTLGAPPVVEGTWAVMARFLGQGFLHVLPWGADHILFMVGLALAAPGFRRLLLLATAFTLAHSLTLGLAVLEVVRLSGWSRTIEAVIAASICAVAIECLVPRRAAAGPGGWREPLRWLAVFAFGLVHGLGFAGALLDLGLPAGARVPALVAFNLGVEAAQVTVISAVALGLGWCRGRWWFHRAVVVPCALSIALAGGWWAWQRVVAAPGPAQPAAQPFAQPG